MTKIILATSLLIGSFAAQAAVAPQYAQVKKFEAVLHDSNVINGLGAGIVKAITEVKPNVFAVEFDKYRCTYLVTVAPLNPTPTPSAGDYTVTDISQPTCERP